MPQNCHKIDYQITGDDMQLVEIELDPQESVIAEAGSMMLMESGIQMETIFGDGSPKNEGFGAKLLGAGKRLLTGESLFMTAFTNEAHDKKRVAFAAAYPGKIIPLDLSKLGHRMICQKDAFLCAAKGVSLSIAFTKQLGAGFFGGEGFILQQLEGDGLAFVHAGGTVIKKTLQANEVLKIDTGCLVAMTHTIDYDITLASGIKTALFGGEGLFLTTLKGPGTVLLQSLPFSRLASRIFAAAPPKQTGGGQRQGEGSLLNVAFDVLGGN